ncbi:MAG: hypothetical protein QGG39_08325 [Candidatus Poribacteria bacterium]|nr:hypothetical protein [Candidatus Poribacteria bacterium]
MHSSLPLFPVLSSLNLNGKAVACICATHRLESLRPLWSVTPAGELVSSDWQDNPAYATADISRPYIVYFLFSGILN